MAEPRQYHILVVADDPDQSTLFSLVLERAGYRVTSVATARAALSRISKESFDLIITDYMLPDFNGDVLIEQIRQQGIETKIVMMSNHVDAHSIARKSNADGCYPKDDIFRLQKLVAGMLAQGT